RIVQPGASLGIIAAQSIGEPGTQLTMRTFHLGGTASASFREPVYKARVNGHLYLENARTVDQADGTSVVLNKHATITLKNEKGIAVEENKLYPGTVLYFKEGELVKTGQKYAEWDAYNVPMITEHGGTIEYKHLVDGVTMNRIKNKKTGAMEISVLEHHGDMHPQIIILDPKSGEMVEHYSLPGGTTIVVDDGQFTAPGTTIARTPRQSSKTKDITGGLPRVAELLEARRPKDVAEIARIDGTVEISEAVSKSNKRTITVRDINSGEEEKHQVPASKRIVVYNGDYVRKGQPLTDGSVDPHDILEVCGAQDLQSYLVDEVQMVYRLQGVEINDKHLEIIVRQMIRKVKITNPGTTDFIYGEQIDKKEFYSENNRVIAEGGEPAEAEPVLLGITKASLETESFISAASFQDTTRILTDAATFGKVDELKGFKENVIMGQLIPAGTGHISATTFNVTKNVSNLVGDEDYDDSQAEEAAKEEEAIANAKALLDL
ncbi:MAG: DNA-directed RNA polymerase subunit beta', partial [Lentisphaeria bacterium]